jgi:hypothetical protein
VRIKIVADPGFREVNIAPPQAAQLAFLDNLTLEELDRLTRASAQVSRSSAKEPAPKVK